jgi:hypothetical protein
MGVVAVIVLAASLGACSSSSSTEDTGRPRASTPLAVPLTFSVSENPFRCDGPPPREFATLHGAIAGEQIRVSSSPEVEVGGPQAATANGSGSLTLIWQCGPHKAGDTWTITATGQTSGRTGTFTITGA